MKRVYTSKDRAALEVLRGLLRQAGVESTVLNENASSVLGEVPFFLSQPEVWVAAGEDAERAAKIVAAFESGAVRHAQPTETWTCPDCGETQEGQFTQCWRCTEGDPRDDAESQCRSCGYLLRGLPERTCPECGTAF